MTYSDGTLETNAYSCCRLLWRRDREGRKTLRSAQTGKDSLYYADEDVWLGEVGNGEWGTGNGGYKVTQHFFDGLGRETNTVVYAGATPGEAAVPSQSPPPSPLSQTTVFYNDDLQVGNSWTRDERGVETTRWLDPDECDDETLETVSTNWVETSTTSTTRFRNGGTTVRREWPEWTPGGPQPSYAWTEERRFDDYAPDGSRIAYVVTESSDNGVVTNSVSTYDLLGRLVTVATPCTAPGGSPSSATAIASNSYDGTSSRILESTYTAGDIVRTTTYLYNDWGEQVGTVLDGVTNRTDTAYETDSSNIVWRVVTDTVIGPTTNSLHIVRTRLTGLSDACRRHTIELVGRDDPIAPGGSPSSATATLTETLVTFDPETGIETEAVTSSVAPMTVRRYRHGILLSTETIGETTLNCYDAFGRLAATGRTGGSPVPGGTGTIGVLPVASYEYSPSGDLLAAHTYTNGDEVVSETYAYDMFGNRISTTDALGNTIFKSFDPFGHVLAERGATYPVQYTYDTQGRRTSLSTTRDGTTWDTTTWTYDHATGNCLSKTYADNSQVLYTNTPDNLPLRTTYASGRWRENVYDERRQVVGMEYSDGETVSLAYDAFLNEIASSNNVATANLDRDARGDCTNDTAAVGNETKTISRTYDAFRRLTGMGGTIYAYSSNGSLASISNAIAFVEYAYTPDRLDAGYSLTLSNGVTFARNLVRDDYRRSLVAGISSVANGVGAGNLSYTYDALNRPTIRNSDTFGYNARGEVTEANINGNSETHEYDGIGNTITATLNSETNTYTANNLNQYTSIISASAPPCETVHDADGNMLSDGNLSFTYDAANRLKTVSSNGVLLVTNFYDAKSRRVKKVTQEATITFFYDAWNLIEERISYTNGTSSTIHYYWGKDLSGTLQGVGGVGGLLYLTVADTIYIPCYDNNGNVTRYLDANGNVVAAYTYDVFGKLMSQTDPLADFFRHRFSTKYYDTETGLYYYGYRFYHPVLMRWVNRDPIGERGGMNLYAFCKNATSCFFDDLGGQTSSFTFAGDPNKKNDGRSVGDYIALWGPNQGSFSVMWEYEGSDCCDENKETEKHGPLFFNATSDYYPVWNMETIDENVPIPYLTPAFGVNGLSGATQGKVYGEKGKMTITVIWTSSSAPANTYLNPTGNTDYYRHGAAWNLPNHFPWTDRPFAPFGNEGKVKNQGSQKVVITASWNNCTRAGEEIGTRISGVNETGSSIGIGKPRNKQR